MLTYKNKLHAQTYQKVLVSLAIIIRIKKEQTNIAMYVYKKVKRVKENNIKQILVSLI